MIRGAGRYSTLITPTAGSLFHAEFQASRRRAQGATLDELARSYNVSRATISRLAT